MKDIQLPIKFKRIRFLDKLLFTKHLSIMLKSGIPLAEAITTLSIQTKSQAFRVVLKALLKDISNGQSLSASLKRHPKVFDHFYTSLIEVSEESGTLDTNLTFLADQLAKEYSLQKKVKGALMYPAVILTAMTLVGITMSLLVLPKLVDLFSSLDVDLPLSTQILLFFANVMKHHGVLVLGGFILLMISLRLLILHPSIKPHWHSLLLSLPIIGPFIQNQQMASICRNMGVMLKSGLPIRKALEVQEAITTNLVFRTYILHIQKAVTKGSGIEQELSKGHFSKMSPVAIKMIGVGEKTGKLDEVFLYLGDFFEDEVDDTARNLSTILEPIILLLIGLVVGYVALAIISPIYELTSSIGR